MSWQRGFVPPRLMSGRASTGKCMTKSYFGGRPITRNWIDPAQRDHEVSQKLHFVSRFLDQHSCLMEIGAGDCAFSLRAPRQ